MAAEHVQTTRTCEFLDTFARGELDEHIALFLHAAGKCSESWFLSNDQRAYDVFYS